MRNGHHIVHERQEWSLRPEARAIRETKSLIPRIDVDAHNEIHRTCPSVPLLGYHALKTVNREFERTPDTLTSMDNLIFAIEMAAKHPKAHYVERGLAELAMWAVDLQRPIIASALSTGSTIIDLGA